MIQAALNVFLPTVTAIFLSLGLLAAEPTTVIEDIPTWNHPVKGILNRHKVVLHKIELLNGKTYPLFYVTFPYDPLCEQNDRFFKSLFYETLKANGYWKYSFISSKDDLKITISWNKKTKAPEEDIQSILSGPKPLTSEQAKNKVEGIPEVKKMKQSPSPVHVELMENKTNEYILRAYTIVPPEKGLPGHTATLGWYSVYKKTGKVTSVLP